MRRHSLAFIAIAILTLTLCKSPWAAEDGSLPFSLFISKTDGKEQSLPLLPIIVTLALTNNTLTTQSILHGLGAEDPGVEIDKVPPRFRFLIEGPDGAREMYFADWVNWDWNCTPNATPQVLGPKQSVRMEYCLALGLPRVPAREMMLRGIHSYAEQAFPTPGRFQVQLILSRLGTAGLKSNILPVEITEPVTDQDKITHDILSQTGAPEVLLPLWGARLAGPNPLLQLSHRGLWGEQATAFRKQAYLAASKILTDCPDSAYAPYARFFWGHALAVGIVEREVDGKPPQTVDFARRAEGLGLLRESADDPALPVRYREEALIALSEHAKRLDNSLRYEGRLRMPTVAGILGEAVDLRGLTEQDVLRNAYLLARGPEATRASRESLLTGRFTAEQIEKLKAVASTDPAIVQTFGGGALQEELKAHDAWARAELDRIARERPNYVRIQARWSGGDR